MKAKYTVFVNGVKLSQCDYLEFGGRKYVFRGCKDGKTLALTVYGQREWVYFPVNSLKGVEVKGIEKPKAEKPVEIPAAKTPAKKPAREGYSKQKGLEAKSDFIRIASEGVVCSYNMWGSSARQDNGVLTVTNRKGKKQKYALEGLPKRVGESIVSILCRNHKGDLLNFLFDKTTNERYLLVIARA